MDKPDAWNTPDTGFKTGRATVTDAFFQPTEFGLSLVLVKDYGDGEDAANDYYAVGRDWSSPDGGETIEHSKGKEKIGANSAYWTLIVHSAKAGIADTLKQRGQPMQASVWKGLDCEWDIIQDPTRKMNQQGVWEEATRNVNVPVTFYGAKDVGSPPHNASAKQEELPGSNGLLPANIQSKAKLLAKTKPHDQWVDEVSHLLGGEMDDNLVAAVSDPEALYKQLREG